MASEIYTQYVLKPEDDKVKTVSAQELYAFLDGLREKFHLERAEIQVTIRMGSHEGSNIKQVVISTNKRGPEA